MSEQKPPLPPDDDRELDDFLAGRSELSRLYRDDAANVRAPAALDAAVLAAARATVAGKPTTRRWRRWRIPLSLAASMLVGIGVLREAQQLPAPLPDSAGAPAVVAAAAVVAPSIEQAPAPQAEAMRRPETEAGPRSSAAARELPPPVKPTPPALKASPLSAPPAAVAAEIPVETPSTNAPDFSEEAFMAPPPVKRAKAAAARADSEAALLADPWRPARYRGQALGAMTVADWQRRYGQPPVTSAPSADAKMTPEVSTAETRRQQRLDYGRSVDARGVLILRANEDSQRIEGLSLRLTPALPLQQVEQAEGLRAAAHDFARANPAAGDAAGCRDEEAGRRLYPAEGIELRLDGDGWVAEILYLAVRPPTSVCKAKESE